MDNQEDIAAHSLEANALESEPMNKTLITACDESLLIQVEQDLVDIMTYQSRRNRLRMKNGKLRFLLNPNKYWLSIRKILLVLCIVFTVLLVFQAIFQPDNKFFLIMLPIYVVITFGLWCVRDPNSQNLANYVDKKSANSAAKKILKKVRKVLPYVAYYEFLNNTVTYYRNKNKQQDSTEEPFIWSKKLEAFAIVNSHATLFYKSSTTIIPRMLIMHDDPQQIIVILERLNIEFIIHTPELHNQLFRELV